MAGLRARRLAAPFALAVLLAGSALAGSASEALAHAQLVASTPGAGEIVDAAPAELRLVFSEPLEAESSSLDLLGPDGEAILTRAGGIDPDDEFALVAELPALEDGAYTVRWRTLSAADGHGMEGSFSFGIGDPGAIGPLGGTAVEPSEATPAGMAARLLVYIGFMLAFGVAAFHRLVIRAGPMPRRLARPLAVGLLGAAVGSVMLPLLETAGTGSPLDALLGTRGGTLALGQAVVALVGAGLLLGVPAGGRSVAAATAGLIGIALHVAGGHAAAEPGIIGIAGQVVHVAAAATWIGGIVGVLVAIVAPRFLADGVEPPPLRTIVPRFSSLALVAIGLVAMTGLLASWTLSGSILDLGTPYGRTLLVKLALVGVALLIGALNYVDGGRGVLRPLGPLGRLRGETGAVAGILVVTALLATTNPTDAARGARIEPVPDAFGQIVPDVAMEIVPGRPGVNQFLVDTTDAIAFATLEVDLELNRLDAAASSRIPLTHAVGGHGSEGIVRWTAGAQTLAAGSSWDASVLIVSDTGEVLSRQRFTFAMGEDGVTRGRMVDVLDPATIIAAVLFAGGTLALGLGLGGARLPRCEERTSRLALVIGGAVGAALGIGVGLDRLLRVIG